MDDDAKRLMTIRDALAAAVAVQDVERAMELDIDRLAAAVSAALAQAPNPIDPEGDGLEPDEINAANDV